MLNGVLKEFAPLINEKEIKMSIKCDENMYINRDKDRINQVFSNIIKNAIDFVTPKIGDIVIGAKDDANFVEFFVQDNGPGISIENQKEIFKKFYQIDTSSSRKRSGSGLGLTICKGIIEGLGGKIRVKSKENIKTTFYFKIPKNPIKLSIKNISTKNQ
jgi:signal transduction histidine kinase